MVAALSVFGNAISTAYQARAARELTRQKFQNDLVLAALNTDDPKVAAKRLGFLRSLGYVNDPDGLIKYYIDNPERLPVGPWPGDKPPGDPTRISKPSNFPDAP